MFFRAGLVGNFAANEFSRPLRFEFAAENFQRRETIHLAMALGATQPAYLPLRKFRRHVPRKRGAVRAPKRGQGLTLRRGKTKLRRFRFRRRFGRQTTLLPLTNRKCGQGRRGELIFEFELMAVQATGRLHKPFAALENRSLGRDSNLFWLVRAGVKKPSQFLRLRNT
jgi:hypothetical protein